MVDPTRIGLVPSALQADARTSYARSPFLVLRRRIELLNVRLKTWCVNRFTNTAYWWEYLDLNQEPLAYQASALTSWAIFPKGEKSIKISLDVLNFSEHFCKQTERVELSLRASSPRANRCTISAYGAGHRIRTCEAFATAYKAVPFDHFGKPAFFWWVPHFRYAISRFLCPSVMPLYEKPILAAPNGNDPSSPQWQCGIITFRPRGYIGGATGNRTPIRW